MNRQGAAILDQKAFSDNVFQAYQLIEKDQGSSGIKGFDLNKLARMLCIDFPAEVTTGIVALLDKRDEENVDFDEFLNAVRTILMFENFFDELDSLFRHLDSLKTGKIKIKELVDACNKLSSPEMVGQHEMRVPPGPEIDAIYKKMTAAATIETAGQLN